MSIDSFSKLLSFEEVSINEINLSKGGRLFFSLNFNSFSKKIKGSGFVIWFIILWFELYVWKYTVAGLPVLPARPDNWW